MVDGPQFKPTISAVSHINHLVSWDFPIYTIHFWINPFQIFQEPPISPGGQDKYSYLRTRNRRYEADFHARYTGVRLNGLKTQARKVAYRCNLRYGDIHHVCIICMYTYIYIYMYCIFLYIYIYII